MMAFRPVKCNKLMVDFFPDVLRSPVTPMHGMN